MYNLKAKAWLEKDNKLLIGQGRARLLQKIDDNGSLTKAAEEMKMSYRHAWEIIKKINNRLGQDVVISKRGGVEGGKTELTDIGKKLLNDFKTKNKKLDEYIKYGIKPNLTVDGAVFIDNKIVLIKRKNKPFKDFYAFPGGFVEYGETVEKAVIREVEEETGLITEIQDFIGVYSKPDRDPRGHTVSIIYRLNVIDGELKKGSDAKSVELFEKDKIPNLAFDHNEILKDIFHKYI